jgi:NhaA family Na+:H+ antiporter
MTRAPHLATPPDVRRLSPLRDFLHTEAAGGVLLALSALIALLWANSPWSDSYHELWETMISVTVGDHTLALDLKHVINDGLMTVFFFVVGLEIRRELATGHLSTRRSALLPVAGALGGMVVPALIYLAIAAGTAPRGWAIPVATDIALAIGVLAVVGSRVQPSLRAFLLGLAIVDDIGAIIIIAAVYSSGLEAGWLVTATVAVCLVVVAQRIGVQSAGAYLVLGAALWLALHEAGVHATLAGVAMGLLAPTTPRLSPELVDIEALTDLSTVEQARATSDLARGSVSVVEWLQYALHPWTSYLIVPLFALANSGIEISVDGLRDAAGSPITWGIVCGLVIGKPLGIMIATRLAVRTGVADGIDGVSTRQSTGVGAAAGIGFTVALFITDLAFTDEVSQTTAKLAVLVSSIVAASVAFVLLRWGTPVIVAVGDVDSSNDEVGTASA